MDGLIEFAKKQCVIFPDDSEMGKYLRETLKILQESPCEDTDIKLIHTGGLDEGIRCAMCTNSMKSDRGCDGGCVVNESMYKKVLEVVEKHMKEQESCEDAISRQAVLELAETIQTDDFSGNEILEVVNIEDVKALPSLTPTQRWIPVSERLPKERGMYIVTEKVFSVTDKEHTGGFNLMTEQVEFDNGKWRRASFYEVIAWMPLLKPYKVEMEGGE